jgi:HJR/Mrr/RecB family endonuclease
VLAHFAALAGIRALYRRRYGEAAADPNAVLGATQQLERFSDDVVHPFLARSGIIEGRPVRVPEEEIELLAALFRRGGWFAPGAEPVDWFDFLTACALRRDFVLFRQRIEYYRDADPIAVYANLHPQRQSDRLALPFLQEILSRAKQAADPESVEPIVEHYRAEFKLSAFSKDLEQRRKTETFEVSIEQVDRMNPFSFEELLGMIYEADGYRTEVTKKSGDQGADVIIEKAGERCVVQAKLYGHPVGNGAVQEVLAARTFYKCHRAIVVTNNSFTKSAIELANSGNITLIGREELVRLISEFNKRAKDYAHLAALMTPAAPRIEALSEALPVDTPTAGTVEPG